jgi:hypothetical protein
MARPKQGAVSVFFQTVWSRIVKMIVLSFGMVVWSML